MGRVCFDLFLLQPFFFQEGGKKGVDVDVNYVFFFFIYIASLQLPYLISLAGLINSYLPDFPFSPRPTFRLLRKMDTVFSSLLKGEDAETGAVLSGFEGRSKGVVSMTEKVRIKGLAERGRIAVIEAREGGGEEDEDEDEEEDWIEEAPGRWEMEAAKVYEKTIQFLGDEMGNQGPI